MDGQKFDALARIVGATRSRRQVFGALGGGALAGLGLRRASAAPVGTLDCTGTRQRCDRDDRCCGGGRFTCDRISRDCEKKSLRGENRCCGKKDARCADSCDCCNGFTCSEDNVCVKD